MEKVVIIVFKGNIWDFQIWDIISICEVEGPIDI